MVNLQAVDAKIERARSEMRLLKADISDFCEERARLILREECEDQERWVYRGGDSKAPVQWSIRVGEFAYNLRSALDHLVWQLASAHGQCAGKHKEDRECPGTHNEFPVHDYPNLERFERQLCGVSPAAREHVERVQPYRRSGDHYPPDSDRVRTGLAVLRDICNRDKHQRLLIANVRWTGEWLKVVNRASFYPMPKQDERSYLDPKSAAGVEIVDQELRYGETLLITSGFRDWAHLAFPVDAYFDRLPGLKNTLGLAISVTEALDSCFEAVDMVVSRLRGTIRSMEDG